jgi:hypothetical protein
MRGDDSRDLVAAERLTPLVAAAFAKKPRAGACRLDEAVALFHAGEHAETGMVDRAFEACAILAESDQARDLAEPFTGFSSKSS